MSARAIDPHSYVCTGVHGKRWHQRQRQIDTVSPYVDVCVFTCIHNQVHQPLHLHRKRIKNVTASSHLEWPCVDRFTPDPLEAVDADTQVSAVYDQWVSSHRSTRA